MKGKERMGKDSKQNTERDPGTVGTFSEVETTIRVIQQLCLSTWGRGERDIDIRGHQARKVSDRGGVCEKVVSWEGREGVRLLGADRLPC